MSKQSAASSATLPELGVGITYTSAVEPLIRQHPQLFDVVEIEPQTTWIATRYGDQPYRVVDQVMEQLEGLPGRKLIHSVGTPIGGTVRPDPAQLELLRQTIARFGSPWASDHLSFNATPEHHTGFFLPPRQTSAGLEAVATGVSDLQVALGVPIAVETGVNYLRSRPDEMADGDFVAAVVATTGCGILLDLHNVFANSLNGRQPVERFIEQIPLEHVWEVHLAGGFELDGFWLDAHSGAIPPPLLDIARAVIPALPNLKAIIFEIFPSFVPVAGLDSIRGQMEHLHELWSLRGRAAAAITSSPHPRIVTDQLSPTAWERVPGGLAIGQAVDHPAAASLGDDPGVAIVRRLINEFRASMVVGVLRLTSRLLMLALSPEIFRALLQDFWKRTPPQPFASAEAEAFAEYLNALDLQIPQLAKILEFERAVLATVMDDQPRVVRFAIDPLPMLRALAEGRLTDIPGAPGDYEIEITPDGPAGASGLDLSAVQQAFPFH